MINPQPILDNKDMFEFTKPLANFQRSSVGAPNFGSAPALNRHQCWADRQLKCELPMISFRRDGQFVKQLERVRVMAFSLDHRIARCSSLACNLEIFDGLIAIVCPSIVMRKFGRNFACAFTVSLLLTFCDPAMQFQAMTCGHASVKYVGIERMLKTIL